MPYAFATLGDAVAALSARLEVSGAKFWTSTELQSYIREALRTWQALTSFNRAEFVFTLALDTWWYDIPSLPGSLRPHTLTDNNLLTQMEYHLLEPATTVYPLVWTGSAQFTVADLLSAIQRRQDETLSTTGCNLTRSLIPSPLVSRVFIADATLGLRRVVWFPTPGLGYSRTVLRQSDVREKECFDYDYTTTPAAPPEAWMQNSEPALSFDVDRVPPVPGQYEVLTMDSGGVLSTLAATLLTVPDDWAWVVKWGALADVLGQESNAKDAVRAEYCARRYQEGLGLLSTAGAVLSLRLNNLPLSVDAVRNGDDFNPLWQVAASGSPASAYAAGLNLLAFGPAPDSGTAYSMSVSVVQNALVPAMLTDFIQVSRSDYDSILDYAQHLAAFKMGGAEFIATLPLYQKFLRQAALYNSKLSAMGSFWKTMYEVSQLQESREPQYSSPKPSEVLNG